MAFFSIPTDAFISRHVPKPPPVPPSPFTLQALPQGQLQASNPGCPPPATKIFSSTIFPQGHSVLISGHNNFYFCMREQSGCLMMWIYSSAAGLTLGFISMANRSLHLQNVGLAKCVYEPLCIISGAHLSSKAAHVNGTNTGSYILSYP